MIEKKLTMTKEEFDELLQNAKQFKVENVMIL
jgi:hypothetical protein